MQETWVQSLGQQNPPQKDMATHSSVLAWKIPWTEEPGGLQPMGLQRVRHYWLTKQQCLCHSFKGCVCPVPLCFTFVVMALGSVPGHRTKIPQAAWWGKNNKIMIAYGVRAGVHLDEWKRRKAGKICLRIIRLTAQFLFWGFKVNTLDLPSP